MINKKAFFKILIVILLLIIIIFTFIQIRNTLARYETTATAERDVEVAFWVVDNDFKSDRILIKDIFPKSTPFEYTFTVSNFSGTKSAETDLEYEFVITTTTNLPLSYEIIKKNETQDPEDDKTCTKEEQLKTDADGTYYREIKLQTDPNTNKIFTMDSESDITDTFVMKVTFPQEYNANEQYADLMEDIKIDLTARQVIEETVVEGGS